MIARIRRDPALTIFTALSYAFGMGVGAVTGAAFVPVYAVTMAALIVLILWIDSRVRFDRGVLWGMAIWLLGHLIGGLWVLDGEVMYSHWIIQPVVRYDNVVHAWGFGAAGVATLQAMRLSLGTSTRLVAFMIVWFGGMAIGAVNEIVEWLGTKVQEHTNVGDFENAMRDLAANAIGAAIAAWRWGRPPAVQSPPTPQTDRSRQTTAGAR